MAQYDMIPESKDLSLSDTDVKHAVSPPADPPSGFNEDKGSDKEMDGQPNADDKPDEHNADDEADKDESYDTDGSEEVSRLVDVDKRPYLRGITYQLMKSHRPESGRPHLTARRV